MMYLDKFPAWHKCKEICGNPNEKLTFGLDSECMAYEFMGFEPEYENGKIIISISSTKQVDRNVINTFSLMPRVY